MHFRRGAPAVRLTGSTGEMLFDTGAQHAGWTLTQDVEVLRPRSDYASARAEGGSLGGALPATVRTEMPWPAPQFSSPYGAVYCLDDVIRSHLGGDATACRKQLSRCAGTLTPRDVAVFQGRSRRTPGGASAWRSRLSLR